MSQCCLGSRRIYWRIHWVRKSCVPWRCPRCKGICCACGHVPPVSVEALDIMIAERQAAGQGREHNHIGKQARELSLFMLVAVYIDNSATAPVELSACKSDFCHRAERWQRLTQQLASALQCSLPTPPAGAAVPAAGRASASLVVLYLGARCGAPAVRSSARRAKKRCRRRSWVVAAAAGVRCNGAEGTPP